MVDAIQVNWLLSAVHPDPEMNTETPISTMISVWFMTASLSSKDLKAIRFVPASEKVLHTKQHILFLDAKGITRIQIVFFAPAIKFLSGTGWQIIADLPRKIRFNLKKYLPLVSIPQRLREEHLQSVHLREQRQHLMNMHPILL